MKNESRSQPRVIENITFSKISKEQPHSVKTVSDGSNSHHAVIRHIMLEEKKKA